MATDILLPPLSQTMDSLIFVVWLKNVGDHVEKGEILYQVETDKATLEVESPASGILTEVLVDPGAEVPVKSKIGVIASPGETVKTQSLPSEQKTRIFASPRARKLAEAEGISLREVKATGPQSMIVERDVCAYLEAQKVRPPAVRVTPLAKRVAEAKGVDLEAVAQTLPGKLIRKADVEEVLSEVQTTAAQPLQVVAPVSLSGRGRPVALSALRKTIARRMQQSHQNTAPVTLTREVDATEFVHLRANILEELSSEQIHPTYTDFLVMVLARTLLSHPAMNAHFIDDGLVTFDEVNIGLAVDTDRGLVVPVIRNAENLGLLGIAAERGRLVQRALAGSLTQDEVSDSTFTITNLGSLGVDSFTPIINPPQVAILGIGRIRPVPAVFEDQVSIRQVMVLSLTFDHRVIDGAPAARFLQDVTKLIERPHRVWL